MGGIGQFGLEHVGYDCKIGFCKLGYPNPWLEPPLEVVMY